MDKKEEKLYLEGENWSKCVKFRWKKKQKYLGQFCMFIHTIPSPCQKISGEIFFLYIGHQFRELKHE